MTKRRKPRKQDTRVTYTPQQTQRYKSQWSRYQKGLKIAAEHAVHKIDEETYRIPSVRAKDGFWEISRKPNKGIIDIEWQGRKPNKGIINVEWQGRKPNKGIINVTWEGRKCRENPPPPDGPGSFPNLSVSGCNPGWSLLVGFIKKVVAYDPSTGFMPVYADCSIEEFVAAYKLVGYAEADHTIVDVIADSGGTGEKRSYAFGWYYDLVTYGFNLQGDSSYSVPAYRLMEAGTASIDVPVSNPQQILDAISNLSGYEYWQPDGNGGLTTVKAMPQVFDVRPPSGSPTPNCDLYDFADQIRGGGGSCKRGESVFWQCDYNLEENEYSENWTKISDSSIKNDKNYVKTLSPCPPPEPLGNIKLKSINSVTSTSPDGWAPVNWDCEYNLEENEYSENWTIISDDSIKNNKDYVKQISHCPPPERIDNEVEIVNINFVTSTQTDGWAFVNWDCEYNLEENEYSENWTIISDDSIKNDKDYVKQVSPCPPPERIEDEVGIVNINSVEPTEKGGYKCTCPDFSKKEGAFTPPAYPSMSQERSWESSDAGAPTWSDGKRRCCHIVAVQQVRKEQIPLPTDM